VGIFRKEDKSGPGFSDGGSSIDLDDKDAAFIIRCLAGNAEAFSVLVERHQNKMLNIAYRMTSDYQDALDIVQDAFLTAYNSLNKFRGESLFSTWLTGIVINQARNTLRKQRNLKKHQCRPVESSGLSERDCLDTAASHDRLNQFDVLEKKDMDIKIQECISGLEVGFREVLVLREIEDYSYQEIGNMMNLPDGTVRSRLFRAREMLKDCIKKLSGAFI